MKKFKKLIPAFCAMLVSAAMLGTSTYAWFSVNKKVEANGMSVTAIADTQYFVISSDQTFSTATENGQSVELTETQLEQAGKQSAAKTAVKPAAYGKKGDMDNNGWYTANVTKYDSTDDADIFNVSEISGTTIVYDNNDYFIGYKFYVGLAEGSSDYTGDLRFQVSSGATNGAAIAAVKVQQQEYSGTAWSNSTSANNNELVEIAAGTSVSGKTYYQTANNFTLSASKTAGKCVEIIVYVYLDGNNANVIDSKAATLEGEISLKIGAEDAELVA